MVILKKPTSGVKQAGIAVFLKNKVLPIFLACGFLVFPAANSLGAVIVFDNVTTVGTPAD